MGPDFCTNPRKFFVVVGSESGSLFCATGSLGGAADAASTDSMAKACNAIDVCWNSPTALPELDISEGDVADCAEEDDIRRLVLGEVEEEKSELLNSEVRLPLPDVGDAKGSSMIALVDSGPSGSQSTNR